MKITHDFHMHTNLSLCAVPEATLETYLDKARTLGLRKMAITDHLWDHAIPDWGEDPFYTVQDCAHVESLRAQAKAASSQGLEVLFGCETEYSFRHHRPAISPAAAERMEVLLVPNSHTHITMPKSYYEPHRKHAEYMLQAFDDIMDSDVARYITAIPHPFLAVACPYSSHELLRLITDDEFKARFTKAAEKGIALELNPNYIRKETLAQVYEDPILHMFRIGKACGCRFTVGSDTHSPDGQNAFDKIYTLISLLELKESDFHPLTR